MTGAAAVGERLTIELDGAALERLDALRDEDGRSRSEAVRTLIEEGLRMAKHPGIVFRPGPAGRRASLADGPDVWSLARVFLDQPMATEEEIGRTVARSAGLTGWEPHQVRIALGYYLEYGDEIRAWIRELDEYSDRAEAEWLRKRRAAS